MTYNFFQSYVPSGSKDEKYWEKRVKNNIAARRSREARRLKENQVRTYICMTSLMPYGFSCQLFIHLEINT